MRRLDQKVALVTGGASGLGRAIGRRLSAEGARVVITDVQTKLGQETAVECGFTFIQQDVCNEARWIEVVDEIETRFQCLSILVNNAGILGSRESINPENTRLADWRHIFAVNLESVFLGCRTSIPAMKRTGGGSIINISSTAGLLATPYATAYGASKAAVRQLTQSVAQHCAQERLNIRCNSVHPGDVRTPMWDKGAAESARLRGVPVEEIIAEERADCPLGDFTLPEDVAAAVSFLASDDARYVTGERLLVDGGRVNCSTYRKDLSGTASELRASSTNLSATYE